MSKGKTKTKTKKLTATQRIEGLENAIGAMMRSNQIFADEIDGLRQVVSSLARRLNATIKSGEQGNLSSQAINDIITQENVAELKGKVDFLIEQGVLESSENGEVDEKAFVVGRELDEDSNVVNPRIQFAISSLLPEMKELFLGKKVGDVVKNEKGDGLLMEIVEVFNIPQKVEKNLQEGTQETSQESTVEPQQ